MLLSNTGNFKNTRSSTHFEMLQKKKMLPFVSIHL
jgi:hypothetical protein